MQHTGAALGGGFLLLIIIFAIFAFVFWLWMLIDCLTSNKSGTEKLVWFLVIFFLHFLGALLYFFLGRSEATTV